MELARYQDHGSTTINGLNQDETVAELPEPWLVQVYGSTS